MVDKKVFDEFIDMLEYVATNISGLTRPNSDKTYEKMCDLENPLVYPNDNQIDIEIKYQGYIDKAYKEAKRVLKLETVVIPKDINYDNIPNLASEAKEKLKQVRPLTIAQANRISGVNPADISILLVYLESRHKK